VTIAARLTGPVLRPTRGSVRGFALASVIANAVLMCTGAAERLSSSGLGCPDWPQCTKTSLVAASSPGQTSLNTAIAFGNRLLNFPLVAIAVLTFIACLSYRPDGVRRRDLVWLSAALPAGMIAQAVIGGIVVLTKLDPALVAAHFLLSAAVLAAAVVLHVRVSEGAGRARPLVRADLRIVATLLVGVTGLMLVAGTIVTGTGPLAGTTIDTDGHRSTVPRFHFTLQDVTQLHTDIGWFLGALVIALMIAMRYGGAPARVVRLGWNLPAGLVWVHVATSVLLWILVVRLLLSTRERLPLPTKPSPVTGLLPDHAFRRPS
jgi:heme a synthase